MKTRIISAAVAIIFAIIILIFHTTLVFDIAIAALILVALYELFNALDCKAFLPTKVLCYIFSLSIVFSKFLIRIDENIMYYISAGFLLLIFMTFLYSYKTLKIEKLCYMVFETLFVTITMSTLIYLNDMKTHGLFYVVLTLLGAWLADSGAYFAGTFFGKHKLCPNISPKKTVEGLIGGILTNGLIFILIGLIYSKLIADDGTGINYILIFVLGMVCAVLGLIGDLSASLIKRQTGIKDYGNIMPGHGGVMDRFDSVLFVAPFMTIMISLFNIIN